MGQLLADGALRAREAAIPLGSDSLRWSRIPVRLEVFGRLLDRAKPEQEVKAQANVYLQRHAAGEHMPDGGQL
jgi:hypothetical protein